MDIINPRIKQLTKYKSWQLLIKANDFKISLYINGKKKTKFELASEIATKEEVLESRIWGAISNGHN